MSGRTMRDRPIGELLGAFAHETTTLIGQEIELARAEVATEVRRAAAGAAVLGLAIVIALLGAGALTAAAIAGLALVVEVWLAALIVGGALLVIAGIAGATGRSQMRSAAAPVPDRALRSVRDDVEAVSRGVQAGRDDSGREARDAA